jgi:outer membrane protein OmpA-like peptidoglycan-associated protein
MPPHWAEFPVAWVLTGLHILALVCIIRLAMRDQCAHLWPPLLLPFALPLVATGFLPVRTAQIVCVLVWSVGVLGWCSSKDGRCFGPVTSLRERVEDTMSHDPRADQVFEATRHESAKRQRVSLDQALEDPESFFQNCDRALYLSDDVLFDWDQSTLKPESAPQLRKLKRLLAHRPDAHIRLDGHADASGDSLHNDRLSERRARAVALWLETEAGIPAERIETVGRGATQPLVDAPSLRHLNRRVEVAVPCSSTAAPGPPRNSVDPGDQKCREPVDSGAPLIVP